MFWLCSVAKDSPDVADEIRTKIISQPNGNEKDFLAMLEPAIHSVLDRYSGLSGVTVGGEMGNRRATINITIYANELGD